MKLNLLLFFLVFETLLFSQNVVKQKVNPVADSLNKVVNQVPLDTFAAKNYHDTMITPLEPLVNDSLDAFVIAPPKPKDTPKELRDSLLEVHIKASRVNLPLQSCITKLDAEKIAPYNLAQDVPYVLQTTPSLTYTSDAGNGIGYTYLSIRGVDPERIQVNINGVPYNDAESQQVYWVDIPDIMSNTSSVEIQRGVGYSSLGGVGLGGVISLQTTQKRKNPFIKWTTTLGTLNTYKNVIELTSGNVFKGWQIYARGTKLSSDGYIDRAKSDLTSFYIDLSKYGKKYSMHLIATSAEEQTYQAWYGVSQQNIDNKNYTYNIAGTDNGKKQGDPYSNQTDNYNQSQFQFINNFKWNPRNSSSITLYTTLGSGYYEEYKVNQNYNSYASSLTGTGDLVRQLYLNNTLLGLNINHVFEGNKFQNITALTGSFYSGKHFGKISQFLGSYTGTNPENYYSNDAEKMDLTLFNKFILTASNLKMIFDIQGRYISYNGQGTESGGGVNFNKVYAFINPKFGLNFHTKKAGDFFTFVGLGNKEPNRNDILAEDSSHLVSPETLIDFELGYEWKTPEFSIKPNYFLMYYLDQLVPTGNVNNVGASIRQNVDNSLRTGIEVDIKYKLASYLTLVTNQMVALNQIYNYSYYKIAYNESDYSINKDFSQTINYKETPIAMSPAWISFVALDFNIIKNLSFQLNNKIVSRQFLDNTGEKSKSIPMYTYTNIVGKYALYPKFCKEITINIQLNNLFNSHQLTRGYTYYTGDVVNSANQVTRGFDQNYYFPQSGINFLLGGSISFE